MKARELFTKQKTVPFIGEVQQLMGGAMLWFGVGTFIFSGIAAWNTATMQYVRDMFPFLNNIFVCGLIVVCVVCLGLWLQHKFVQPSILAYFNKMQYMSNPLNKDVAANQTEILEVKKIVLEIQKKLNNNTKANNV